MDLFIPQTDAISAVLWLMVLIALPAWHHAMSCRFDAASWFLMGLAAASIGQSAFDVAGHDPRSEAGWLLSPGLGVAGAIGTFALLRRRRARATVPQSHGGDDSADTLPVAEPMGPMIRTSDAERGFRLMMASVTDHAFYLLDRDGIVTSWNPGAEQIKGYTAEEAIGSHMSRFYTENDRAAGVPARALSEAARLGRVESECIRMRKDGTKFLAQVSISALSDHGGEVFGYAQVTKDITMSRASEDRLRSLAHFDQLTGLANRNSLMRDLDALTRSGDGKPFRPVCVALFDLDGFKEVNDGLGHAAGDTLLVEVARRLERVTERGGQLYRLGGDEFVLVIPECDPASGADEIVATMLARVGSGFEIAGRPLSLYASAGIAIADEDTADVRSLLSRADLAMYEAKKIGGNHACWFHPSMRAKVQARQEIEAELQQAYCNDEFELYFQPEVRLRDGAIVGAEALLRWRHPKRGLLNPGEFIEPLSQSSAAANVGIWILRTACEAAASWSGRGLPPIRVGVNLFPVQFGGERLAQDVAVALQSTGLPPSLLELEITENIALGRDEDILPTLQRLRESGVSLAFDDFGTGYASLSYLSRYPLTRIKIDRSFVSTVGPNASSGETAIVRSVIAMGHNLGLEITAEGVETQEQSDYLASLNCDVGQGFYFAKPLSPLEFERFLARHQTLGPPSATTRRNEQARTLADRYDRASSLQLD